MKKQVLLLALSIGALLSPSVGNSQLLPISTVDLNFQSDEIDLRGRIEPGEIRREIKAISAFLQASDIKAQFHFDMGTVQISIVDQTGTMVYSTTVSSSIGEVLIPTTGFPPGNYTVTFTALSGGITGDFTL
ncbi:MAG: DUF3244 domain-containing protein [Sphingobacterium sp.]|jgi:gamma-glutamyltranspeptidase|nr:DUF3244 domain-containing protein [Sphingobacterium sp.]